jgi:GT2 family glycosyltransferase/glycosyltransferase involved in cell wall biosynthesis
MSHVRPGVVSVVVVNYRRPDDTIECLRAFGTDVDWPADRLELVVVENGSGDGSADRLRTAVPGARLVELAENRGFAGGVNAGVAQATGEYIGIINNDARPGGRWVSAAVAAFEADARVAGVASKVLDWEGSTVDYVDGSVTWFGMGYKREVGRPDSPTYDEPRDVLFATGAAMFVRADVWRAVGGFDERYFMFYEDVDLGWRLNLLGHRVRFEPASVAYHRHHASMTSLGPWREHFLLERNALFTMFKNYGDELLAAVLPAAMALSVRRGLVRGGDDPSALDLERGAPPDEPAVAEVSRETLAPAYAIDAFVEALPGLHGDRMALQAARRRADAELLPLFRRPMEPAVNDPRFAEGYRALVDAFAIGARFSTARRIAVLTNEPLTDRMAGPAIRAWAIADQLSLEHDVELATLGSCSVEHPRVTCRSVIPDDVRAIEAWADVLVLGGLVMAECPWLVDSGKVIVVDVYNPFHLEQLEQARDKGEHERALVVDACVGALNQQLRRGDFFLCASPKQRDMWLGQLAAVGRVNPDTYDQDHTLQSLIAVVPFGLPEAPPVHTRPVLKGMVPGIGPDDKVILWGGGVYSWLDPLTLLRAVDRLRHRRPDARLFFMGLRHPNPDIPEMDAAVATRALAESLGLTGTHVFFNEGWVPYDERQSYLLEADVGVSTHHPHVETAFSSRTRILDYLWASLPVVATEGDGFARMIDDEGLGITVPAHDVDALEEALFRLLDDEELAAASGRAAAAAAERLRWPSVLGPLVEFCRAPRRAPDVEPAATVVLSGSAPAPGAPRRVHQLARRARARARLVPGPKVAAR